MPWVYIDDKFDQHPKVIEAGSDAAWLFVAGLCWSNRNLTAGRIPRSAVRLLTDKRPAPLVARLLAVVLWELADGDAYLIHDYDFWNQTAKSMSDRARKAAERRWENERKAKPKEDAPASAPADAGALPEQSSGNAPAHARAPGPLSPLPSPVVKTSPSDSSRGDPAWPETIEATPNGTGVAKLVSRLASVCAVKGPKAKAEALEVVSLCKRHVADQLIDEAIGYMSRLDKQPQHPQYLLEMIPDWAEQRGVHGVPKLKLMSA